MPATPFRFLPCRHTIFRRFSFSFVFLPPSLIFISPPLPTLLCYFGAAALLFSPRCCKICRSLHARAEALMPARMIDDYAPRLPPIRASMPHDDRRAHAAVFRATPRHARLRRARGALRVLLEALRSHARVCYDAAGERFFASAIYAAQILIRFPPL